MNCIVLDLSAQVTKPLEGELWLYRTSKRHPDFWKRKTKKKKRKKGRKNEKRTHSLPPWGWTDASRPLASETTFLRLLPHVAKHRVSFFALCGVGSRSAFGPGRVQLVLRLGWFKVHGPTAQPAGHNRKVLHFVHTQNVS